MANTEFVRNRIVAALADFELPAGAAEDIAFHMTDWKDDLDRLVSLYENPESLDDEEIRMLLLVFLSHVPNHVAAARKLIGVGPIEDKF
jgi:hypothetical protein